MNNQEVNQLTSLNPICKRLKLGAVYTALKELAEDPKWLELSHLEVINYVLQKEIAQRNTRALDRRLKKATIRHSDACLENIDYEQNRGLNKALITALGGCDWIRNHQNCIITGMTGCGKTWIAGALANAACRAGFSVKFIRVPRFLKELSLAKQYDRGFEKELRELRNIDLLVLDDWGIGQMESENRSDILEVIEDRMGAGSTLVTSVLPVKQWADYINDPTYSDSILDRLVLNAHRIEMVGESMRRQACYGAVQRKE